MIFVGYERGSKAYRAYDPLTGRVTITHEVVFDKSTQWCCTGEDSGNAVDSGDHDDTFTVKYRVLDMGEPRTPPIGGASLGTGFHTPAPESPIPLPKGINEEDLDADHDDAPLRLHLMADVVGAAMPPGYAVRMLGGDDEQLYIANAEEPATLM
jgi:hypothetical protein